MSIYNISLNFLKNIKSNKYVNFFRIFDWVHLLGVTFLGLFYVSNSVSLLAALFALFISSLYLAYGYSLNEVFDTATEGRCGKKTLTSNCFSVNKGVFLSSIPLVFVIIFSLLHSKEMFLAVIFGVVLGWVYSAPPVRLKSKALAGLFCNSLCFCPLFLIGALSSRRMSHELLGMAVYIGLVMLPLQLIHELDHKSADSSQGINTTICKYGLIKGLYLILFSLVFLTGWTVLLWYFFAVHIIFVFLTLLFSIALCRILFIRYDSKKNSLNTYLLKIRARYIALIYGIAIFFIFVIRNSFL